MNLKTLRQLDVGTKLQLKGTNVIFELLKIDYHDDERPLRVMVLETDRPILVRLDATHREDDVVIYRHGSGNTGWPFNDKKTIREDAGLDESEFKRRIDGYYVVTLSDLEVYEEDICARFDEHIDPRDLISRGSSPAQPLFADEVAEHFSEQAEESGVLPIAAARQFVNDFNSRKVTIQLINAAIARAAQDGKQVISLADAVNHQVSEEIKDLYRRAGYHVAFETIQW